MKTTKKNRKAFRTYTVGCPLTRNRTPWCHGICRPDSGMGACGRDAPHALRGRTARAIAAYKAREEQAGK
ncbi:MAG: hypothetical protein HN348_05865 [Proteobacteria bacterium]|jgi:hypothetical protein|nr:hypothetical protein [Pseudomonadota bacterium]